MTVHELKAFDGKKGNKAYIAYKGKVYDVTQSPLWKEGEHKGAHKAGVDLTEQLSGAPHGDEVFAKFPVVGHLEEKASKHVHEEAFSSKLRLWYQRYHPHPMLVHFPIALHIFAAGLDLLYLFQPQEAYALAVFYSFFVATVMGLVAMIPGILSWWINYQFSMTRPFIVKIVLSSVTLILGVYAIILYMDDVTIIHSFVIEGMLYHGIVLFTGVTVIILGYYGGKISWSSHHPKQTESPAGVNERLSPSGSLKKPSAYTLPYAVGSDASPVENPVCKETRSFEPGMRSLSILIGAAAGGGIETLEKILNEAFRRCGFYVFSSKEFMSRVRGGSNTVLIRIADAPVYAACKEVDLCIALDAPALEHTLWRCSSESVVLADKSFAEEGVFGIAMNEKLQELGGMRHANTYIAGVLFGLFQLEDEILIQSLGRLFSSDEKNEKALRSGLEYAKGLSLVGSFNMPKRDLDNVCKFHMLDGTTASGFGFLSGGCNFVSSYPMSPSTGLLNFMASMSQEFGICVEQSEDEIASLHMVLGAWYAGARAMTTTSGGGFALMGEGVSLSGMTETPAVIYLAQRPGPATGMPTRSEQGDLDLATFSGHGPFARLILAPGSLHECIDLAYLAFELADRYQIPVIYLTDQYLADSIGLADGIDLLKYEQRRYIISSTKEYRRYENTPGGISPRAIPGFGEGLVCAVGDEHDEVSQITEDAQVRERMVAKRAQKLASLMDAARKPEVRGKGRIAIVGWGSSKGAIREALMHVHNDELVQVHFSWLHPLNPKHLLFLKDFSELIVVENSANAAFAERLKLHGISVSKSVLKANGFPFFADELALELELIIKEYT